MTTASRARRKLEEAHFFLELVHQAREKPREFDFFLSAFISAARSVRWVMTAEYKNVSGWEEWAKGRALIPEVDELLKGFSSARNRIVKEEPLETLVSLNLKDIAVAKENVPRFVAAMKKLAGAPANVTINFDKEKGYGLEFELDGERHFYPVSEIDLDQRLQEFPDTSALDVCKKYVEWLAASVDQCEAKFGVP